jgi:hypothetical protein
MSVVESDIQWFIARDGKQHGPLSDVEMRKLLELGHLRQMDLIWKQGFPDWRPVASVFPPVSEPVPERSLAPVASTRQDTFPGEPREPVMRDPMQGMGGAPARERTAGRQAGPAPSATRDDSRRWSQSSTRKRQSRSGGSRRAMAATLGLLALTGAGGWLAYQYRDLVLGTAGTAITGKEGPTQAKATFETAAVTASGAAAALDAKFQKRPAWTAIKQEFPEWYDVRLKEAANLGAEGKTEAEITQHLIEALVGLRRQHADKALAASTEKHKELATAFLQNLRTLSQQGPDACYGFISKGEASADTVAMMQDAQKSAHLEAQVVAIINAIADGRKSPVTHAAPVKTDYDALAAELGRIGWSQTDMQLFADPKALAKAPHERVCKMVQDWFAAHLAITDAGTQERLLFETIRPVVAG